MPIHDYLCADCGHTFEELVQRDERPSCPECEGGRVEKQFAPTTPVTTESVCEAEEPSAEVDGLASEQVERLEQEWQDRRREPSLDPSDRTLRRDDPDVWDLERDFERRQTGQLAEIVEKGRRIVNLMARIEALEPLTDELAARDRELARLKDVVRALEESERAALRQQDEQAQHLAAISKQVVDLTARAHEHEQTSAQQSAAIETLEREKVDQESAFAKQVLERDRKLDDARARHADLEAELCEHERRVEDALHERESVKAELESRTAALFKRDEMIQAADLEADGLREEVRDRERRVSAMEQQNEALRDEVSLKDSEIRRRDEAVTGLERRVEQLSEQVEQLNVDLVRKGEQLEASQRENKELTDAWANATGEMELHRAKFLESFGHIQLTQSVLAELKPMLDSLESTLNTDDDDVDPALPTSPEEAVSESPSD